MTFADTARIQALLEGVPLPASKRDLVSYVRGEDEDTARWLEQLPDREYRSLDDVGEALRPVQPSWSRSAPEMPRAESDKPPGGDAYIETTANSGAVRPSAPPWNPPEKALQKQSETQQEQQQRQEQELPG